MLACPFVKTSETGDPESPGSHLLAHSLRRLPRLGAGALQVLRANFARLDHPLKLTFALTYWCQYRCQTCNIWQKKPTDELSTEELLEFVERNRGFSWVDVTGGEIFLRKDIETVLGAMLTRWRRLVVFHFATNGYQTRRIAGIVGRLAGLSPAHLVITVSLDGHERLNDEIRGIAGGYRKQIATFQALREIPGVRAVLGMTLSNHNLGQVDETLRRLRADLGDLRRDELHLNVMQLSDHYYSNRETVQLLPPRERARREIHEHRLATRRRFSPASWLEQTYMRNVERFLETGRTPMRCHSLRSSCFIDPWGVVYPCITFDHPVGRLRETAMELEPIWRGEEARERQAAIWEGDCPQCWTACEAYQSIGGNLLRPTHRRPPRSASPTPATATG